MKLEVVHKLCCLGGGMGGSPKDDLLHRPNLIKKMAGGGWRGEGGKNSRFWDDIVYGCPLMGKSHNLLIQFPPATQLIERWHFNRAASGLDMYPETLKHRYLKLHMYEFFYFYVYVLQVLLPVWINCYA